MYSVGMLDISFTSRTHGRSKTPSGLAFSDKKSSHNVARLLFFSCGHCSMISCNTSRNHLDSSVEVLV